MGGVDRAGLQDRPAAPDLHRRRGPRLRAHGTALSICVVVADDHGARQASHALRAAGWGGVAFEADGDAATRTVDSGRACVLNVSRLGDGDVARVVTEPWAYDWRTPPPELSLDEWMVLYGTGDFTPRTAANRMKTALEKMGDDFELWRLPSPS